MERGGYGGGRKGGRGASRNRGRGGEGGSSRGGGRGSHDPPQPQRRSGHSREGTERGGRGRGRGSGIARGGGSSTWLSAGSVHSPPLPSDPVPELGRPQERQRSAYSCMLETMGQILPVMFETMDQILPVHRPDKGRNLAIGTDSLQVKFKPEGVTMDYNIDVKYRKLWSQVIDVGAVVVDKVLEWKSKKP